MRRRWEPGEDLTDEALLSGVAIGDEGATLTFVRRYQRRLFGLALGITGDVGLAEDVAQEAFIRIFRHASVFDVRRGSVTSWVLTITRNLAIDRLRGQRALPLAPEDRVFMSLQSAERSPDESTEAAESVIRVRKALIDLPVEQRRAIVLAAMHGRTAAEVAAQESIPLGTAKSRIRLGMARLRAALVAEEAP